jgi:esterase/lipase
MNMEHWKQAFDKGKFQAFDYGTSQKNVEHYGQSTPPVWDLSKIRVPIRLFAGSSDLLADPTDVQFLWNSLSPEAKEFYKTYNSGHVTFVWGLDVSPWMNDLFSMLQE